MRIALTFDMSGGPKPKALGRPLDGWVRRLFHKRALLFLEISELHPDSMAGMVLLDCFDCAGNDFMLLKLNLVVEV